MFRRESLRGMAVQLFIGLTFIMPAMAARAGEGDNVTSASVGAESRPAGNVSAPAENSPSPSPAAPLAPLLLELRHLKEMVEGQSQRITKQTQELESERAAIRDELDLIAKLETELHASSNEAGNLPVSAAPAPPSHWFGFAFRRRARKRCGRPASSGAGSSGARQCGQKVG